MAGPAGRCWECGRPADGAGVDVVCDDCLRRLERELVGLDAEDRPEGAGTGADEPDGADRSVGPLLSSERADEHLPKMTDW